MEGKLFLDVEGNLPIADMIDKLHEIPK